MDDGVRQEWLSELPDWFRSLDLGVDVRELDKAASEQAKLIMEVSMIVAWVRGRFRYSKMVLQQAEADAYTRLRRQIEESGGKPTEAFLAKLLVQDEEYRKAYLDLVKWEFLSRYAEGVFEAVRERGADVRELAKLYASGYFSV